MERTVGNSFSGRMLGPARALEQGQVAFAVTLADVQTQLSVLARGLRVEGQQHRAGRPPEQIRHLGGPAFDDMTRRQRPPGPVIRVGVDSRSTSGCRRSGASAPTPPRPPFTGSTCWRNCWRNTSPTSGRVCYRRCDSACRSPDCRNRETVIGVGVNTCWYYWRRAARDGGFKPDLSGRRPGLGPRLLRSFF